MCDESNKRLTEDQLQKIFKKIDKEWPIRCKLAELCGFKANPKNPRALCDSEFDLSIRELFLEVTFRRPENTAIAMELIRSLYK